MKVWSQELPTELDQVYKCWTIHI